MDSLIFMPDSITTANVEEHISMERKSSSVPRAHNGKEDRETTENEVEDVVEVENVERPVDLYKAIFSDDSDEEEENNKSNQVEETEKKIEAANTTLNRLMAGDFLESLGKELGLMVPPEMPPPENKSGTRVAPNAYERNESPPPDKTTTSANQKSGQSSRNGDSTGNKTYSPMITQSGNYNLKDLHSDGSKLPGENARPSTTSKARNWSSSSSSEDERSRKHSRSRRRKSRRSSSPENDFFVITPIIGVDDARGQEEMIRKPLGERAAAESIQSIKERILPIEALNTNAKERRINTKTEEMMHLADGVVFEYRDIKFDAL